MAKQSQNLFDTPGMKLALSMSGWLVGPVVIATVIGYFLDQRYGTKPWLFLISLGVAFSLSIFGIVKAASQAFKELAPDDDQDQKKNNSNDYNKE